jgi:hypothetical protein
MNGGRLQTGMPDLALQSDRRLLRPGIQSASDGLADAFKALD